MYDKIFIEKVKIDEYYREVFIVYFNTKSHIEKLEENMTNVQYNPLQGVPFADFSPILSLVFIINGILWKNLKTGPTKVFFWTYNISIPTFI